MSRFKSHLETVAKQSRFSELELQQMFSSEEEQQALVHVSGVLGEHTSDLAAANDLIHQGTTIVGVLTKLARKALGVA